MASGSGFWRSGLYDLFLVSRLAKTAEAREGRSMQVKSCLPVQSSTGLRIAGGGSSIGSAASDM